MPELDKLPRNSISITGSDIYLRLHGRNKESWWTGDNISRYNYLYDNEELQDVYNQINLLINNTERIFIAFNNHYKGQAVKNAEKMQQLLK